MADTGGGGPITARPTLMSVKYRGSHAC